MTKDNPQNFWNLIDKMNRWGKEKINPSDNISAKTWKQHFQKLFQSGPAKHKNCEADNFIKTFDPLLDGAVTKNELREASTKMKEGPDQILCEYLKIFYACC